MSAKCSSPVRYGGEEGSLTFTASLLVYTPTDQPKEAFWQYRSIKKHMIKSVSAEKHMIRLMFDQGDSVILEVPTRALVEQIRDDIGQSRQRLQRLSSVTPAAVATATASAAHKPAVQVESTSISPPSYSALPPEWHEATDPNTGNSYYWNEDGTTSWERPTRGSLALAQLVMGAAGDDMEEQKEQNMIGMGASSLLSLG